MTRNEIITAVKKNFDIAELVCDHTYRKWRENAWQFLDTDLLEVLYVLRTKIINAPLYCNSDNAHQRGLRCNVCPIVKIKNEPYLSAHILGKALDLSCPKYTAEEMRNMIKQHADELPCPVRIEDDVNWLHIDVMPQFGVSQKVYEFKG